MTRNNYRMWVGVGLVTLAVGGGSVWLWQGHQQSQRVARTLDSSQAASTRSDTSSPVNSANPIRLQLPNVSSKQGVPLSGPSAPNSPQNSGDATSDTSAASKLLDPTTFAQYDKYKDSSTALFIELQDGNGTALSSGHKAAVYYRGWLTNGTMFDESKAGSDGKLQSFVFTQGAHEVIAGWEGALDGMKVGGVRLVIVPPAFGYGASGQGSIPGGAVLVFHVQLAAVE